MRAPHVAMRMAAFLAAIAGGCDGTGQERSDPVAPPASRSSVPAYRVVPQGRVGSVSGTVRWRGAAPAAVVVPVRTHQDVCGSSRDVTSVRLGAGNGVIGAVVTLEGIREGRLPLGGEIRVAFSDCDLTPRIVATSVGATLRFVNDEEILHNLRISSGADTWLDVGLPSQGSTAETTARVGTYRITDDSAHPWIEAWVVVAEHPYIVATDAEGRFQLARVPVGSYQIRVWHPGILNGGPTTSGRPARSAPIVLARPLSVSEANDSTTDFELDAASVEAAGAVRP